MATTLRKNVVECLYVVRCLVNGVGFNEFVKAESDDVAKQKAMANLQRVYDDDYELQIVGMERITPDSYGEDVM